jgi:hypothetical protein
VPFDSFPFACLSPLEPQDANNEHRRSWFARDENDGEMARKDRRDDERSKLRVAQGSSSAHEDEDAEEAKARAWDDWKDDNPRGAGNKKLTPCG